MRIRLNGEDREFQPGMTVAALVDLLELPRDRVAVERNLDVVRRAQFAETRLADGDAIEIVTFVGGG